jgi:hypothetical protein
MLRKKKRCPPYLEWKILRRRISIDIEAGSILNKLKEKENFKNK